MIYHLCSPAAWRQAQDKGEYRAPSLASEGFIHCSRAEQLAGVIRAFYGDADSLLLLCIDETGLDAELRWEAPAHAKSPHEPALSGESFPHLYGALNLDAVERAIDLPKVAGEFALPPDLP